MYGVVDDGFITGGISPVVDEVDVDDGSVELS